MFFICVRLRDLLGRRLTQKNADLLFCLRVPAEISVRFGFDQAVADVVRSGRLALGPQTLEFERLMAVRRYQTRGGGQFRRVGAAPAGACRA